MSRLLPVFILVLATAARAAESEPLATGPEAPAAIPAAPTAPEPAPAPPAKPARIAPPEAHETLDRELKNLSGLARAERLLQFAGAYPDDERAAKAEGEAKELVASAKAHEGEEPVLEAINAVLKTKGPDRRGKLDALAATKDVRALPFIAYLARRDAELETRKLSATLFGRFGPGAAEQFATDLLLDAAEPVGVRGAAAEGLGGTGSAAAGDTLAKVAMDPDQDDDVRQAALDSLRAHYPAVAEKLAVGPRIASSSGRALGTVAGALSGAYTLGLVGALSPNSSVGTAVGGFGGLVIGGAATYLLAGGYDLSQGDALYLLSAGAWSVPTGVFAGGLAGGPTAECTGKPCTAIMLGTHVAAMAGAWATRTRLHLSVVDDLELNLAAVSSTMMMAGALSLPTPGADQRLGQAFLTAGPIIGFAAGAYFADRLRLTFPLAALAVVGAAEGAVAGGLLGEAWVPRFLDGGPLGASQPNERRSTQINGLTYLGFGVGLGGVLAASAFWEPSPSDALLTSVGALDGNFLGAGLPLLLAKTDTDKYMNIGAGLGGLVGAAATLALLEPLQLQQKHGDPVLSLVGRGFAAFQAFGWGAYLGDRGTLSNDESLGFGFTTLGLAGVALTAATQKLDLSGWHAGWLFSGAVWGGWLAGWGAYTADARNMNVLAASLVGSDVGLAAAALLMSPLVGIDPTMLAWVSVGGIAGMTLSTMVATFVAYNAKGHPVALANVIGSSAGLVAGAVVAHALSSNGSGGDVADTEAGPAWLGDVPLPMPSIAPAVDANGRVVPGATAQLVWSM